MLLEKKISILEGSLKDHVTLKTGNCIVNQNKCSLGEKKILFSKIVNLTDLKLDCFFGLGHLDDIVHQSHG